MFALRTADDVIRRAEWTVRPHDRTPTGVRLLLCIVAFGCLYGAAMGSFRGLIGLPQWERQVIYSAIKTPILLTGSFLLTLPTFFVLSTLLGLRRDFAAAVRALTAAQAGVAISLASLAPLTLFCYASTTDYEQALAFNGVMFATASIAGHLLLRAHYSPLIALNSRHRQVLGAWGVAYALVATQLAWLLRPFLGSSGLEVQFLRPEAWDNAYVVVARLIWRALAG